LDLAIRSESAFGSIILEQPRFTAQDTLPILKARFKGAEIYMLMGDDMLFHLGDWPHIDDLLKDVNFIIGLRQLEPEQVEARLKALEHARGLKLRHQIFHIEHSDYASSKIRLNIKRGRPPAGLNPSVADYIISHGLYGPGDN
jgi:nicotinic acid mononucleotide adenylyltransferase